MNYPLFLSVINLLLIARFCLLLRDHPMNVRDALFIGFVPLLVLPFLTLNGSWFLLLGVL